MRSRPWTETEIMRLEIQIGGFDGLQFLDAFVGQMETAADSASRLADAQRTLGTVLKNQMEDLRRQGQAVRDLADPWERLARAKERYNEALKSGDYSQMRSAKYQLAMAQNSADQAQNVVHGESKPIGQQVKSYLFNQLLKRTGLEEIHASGSGGQILSKMMTGFKAKGFNKLAGLFGRGAAGVAPAGGAAAVGAEGAAAAGAGAAGASAAGGAGMAIAGTGAVAALGPIGIAVLALIVHFELLKAAVQAVWEAANQAAQALSQVAAGRFVSGGTPDEQAKLNAIGGLVGMGPEEISDVARNFGENLSTNPKARAEAAARGISAFGGPYGDQNDARRLLEAIERIRAEPNQFAAKSLSRKLDLPDELASQIYLQSDESWARLKQSVTARSPQEEKLGVEFMAELQIFRNNLDSIVNMITSKTLPQLLFGMKLFNKFMGVMRDGVKVVVDYLMNIPFVKNLIDRIAGDNEKRQQSAIEQNTQAVQRLTDALEDGVYGDAAAAARRAVPRGMEAWRTFDKNAYGQRMMVGGIAL